MYRPLLFPAGRGQCCRYSREGTRGSKRVRLLSMIFKGINIFENHDRLQKGVDISSQRSTRHWKSTADAPSAIYSGAGTKASRPRDAVPTMRSRDGVCWAAGVSGVGRGPGRSRRRPLGAADGGVLHWPAPPVRPSAVTVYSAATPLRRPAEPQVRPLHFGRTASRLPPAPLRHRSVSPAPQLCQFSA